MDPTCPQPPHHANFGLPIVLSQPQFGLGNPVLSHTTHHKSQSQHPGKLQKKPSANCGKEDADAGYFKRAGKSACHNDFFSPELAITPCTKHQVGNRLFSPSTSKILEDGTTKGYASSKLGPRFFSPGQVINFPTNTIKQAPTSVAHHLSKHHN